MLTGINENFNNEKPVTEKLSGKRRTICYLLWLRFFLSHWTTHFLIERSKGGKDDTRKFSLRVCGAERVEPEIVPLSIAFPNGMNATETSLRQSGGFGIRRGSIVRTASRMPAAFPRESRIRAGDASTFKENSPVSLVQRGS